MALAKLSAKGQITLPAEARRALVLKPRDRISIHVVGSQIVMQKVADFFELEGFLGPPLPAKKEKMLALKGVAMNVQGKKKK